MFSFVFEKPKPKPKGDDSVSVYTDVSHVFVLTDLTCLVPHTVSDSQGPAGNKRAEAPASVAFDPAHRD